MLRRQEQGEQEEHQEEEQEEHKEEQEEQARPKPPRYFVLHQSEPAAKALGYFAPAWRCRVVVKGVPYDGGYARSKWLAEQKAAALALTALLGSADAAAAAAAAAEAAADAEKAPVGKERVRKPGAGGGGGAALMPRAVRSRLKRPAP